MDRVTVLVTGAGAPGIRGTVYSLAHNPEGRKVAIVGVDMKGDVVGRFLCDRFHQVSPGGSDRFIPDLLDVCDKEGVDVVLPQVTRELASLAEHRADFRKAGVAVAVSSAEAIARANDKCRLLDVAREIGVGFPEYHRARTWAELEDAAGKLGFPFVVKPAVASGMRGFREVHERIDRKRSFFDEKPDSTRVTLAELHGVIGDEFPELLVTEHLPGGEYSVDVLSTSSRTLAVVPRRRDLIRTGITFNGTVERRADIIADCERLTGAIGLEYAHGFQFKEDAAGRPKLLESNPRVQGTMVMATIAGANVIYGAVKLALGEAVPPMDVCWGTKLYRYWGGVGIGRGRVDV